MADTAIVYFSKHAIEHKKLDMISAEEVKEGFAREDLLVFTESNKLQAYLKSINYSDKNLLIMTSGNLDGVDLKSFGEERRSFYDIQNKNSHSEHLLKI